MAQTVNEVRREDTRTTEEIRQDIEQKRQEIAGTVDQLGEKIRRQLDWREYIRCYPFVTVGAAALLGFLISRRVLRSKQRSARDMLLDALERALGREQKAESLGIIKGLAGAAITRIATNYIQSKLIGERNEEEYPG